MEHDASEIWSTQLGVAVEAMSKVGADAEDIVAIGITNQRETVVVWGQRDGRANLSGDRVAVQKNSGIL